MTTPNTTEDELRSILIAFADTVEWDAKTDEAITAILSWHQKQVDDATKEARREELERSKILGYINHAKKSAVDSRIYDLAKSEEEPR